MRALYDEDKTVSFSLLIREMKANENLKNEKNLMLKEVYKLMHTDGIYNDFEKSFYQFFSEI